MFNDDIIFSLDMDGCIFHPYCETLRELAQCDGPISAEKDIEILYEANKELFADLIGIANAANAKKIHLILGTLRQDYETDRFVSFLNNSMSCFHAIEAITTYFREKLPEKEIILHKYILADTYGHAEIGTSFDRALKALSGENPTHHNHKKDESKFTIIYSQLNYFMRELSGQPFNYWLVDDKETMLLPLHKFLKTHPDLIPEKVCMHMKAASYTSKNVFMKNGRTISRSEHQYVTVDEREPEKIWEYNGSPLHLTAIEGTGPNDPAFEKTTRKTPSSSLDKIDENLYDIVTGLRQKPLPSSATITNLFSSQTIQPKKGKLVKPDTLNYIETRKQANIYSPT